MNFRQNLEVRLRRAWFYLLRRVQPVEAMRPLPKIMLHEHLDCSLRPRTMLELMESVGFPANFPGQIKDMWMAAGRGDGRNSADEREAERHEAVTAYQKYLVGFASASLANYVQAVVDHILPLMQSEDNLRRITRERIEDAVEDGIIAFELRFAPQLHTMGGLTLDQVMKAVIGAVDEAPIPVKLVVCALRHEDFEKAKELADVVVKYRRHVGAFDLAADEAARPGVLRWFVQVLLLTMVKARLCGCPDHADGGAFGDVFRTIHMWETNEPVEDDIVMLEVLEGKRPELLKEMLAETLAVSGLSLDAALCDQLFESIVASFKRRATHSRIGHGVRGDRQGNRILEVCPTSNVVTGQVRTFREHPIDRLYREGKNVTVNTDGTLFTEVQLSNEYVKLAEAFGWTLDDFYRVNVTAVEASSFSEMEKAALKSALRNGYLRLK